MSRNRKRETKSMRASRRNRVGGSGLQLTVRSVPPAVARALRRKAASEKRSLNSVIVEALGRGSGVDAAPIHDDLDFLAGQWEEDPAFDAAIAAQDEVDAHLWR